MTTVQLTDDERERVERIDALVALGSVDALVDFLSDTSWTVRRAAVAGLAALGDAAVPALVAALTGRRTSEHAIAATVDALASSLGNDVMPPLVALLEHRDPAIAADAAQILGRRHEGAAVQALAVALQHADDNVGVAAIEALGRIGSTAAIEPLIDTLRGRSFFRAYPALQVLSRSGDPRAIAPIVELLDDDMYRTEAVRALGRTGAVQAIASLAGLAAREEANVIGVVAVATVELLERAAWIGAEAHARAEARITFAPARDRLIASVATLSGEARHAVVTLLGEIGDGATVRVLTSLATDPQLREVATRAIVRLGVEHEDAIAAALAVDDPAVRIAILPALRADAGAVRALLSDGDAEVRARTCEALARLGDVSAVPALFDALHDSSPRVAHAASAAIQSLGTPSTVSRALAALASGGDVRRYALRILAYYGPREALPALLATIDDADPRVRDLAVGALATVDDPQVEVELERLAGDARELVRVAAMRAVATRRSTRLAHVLERGLDDEAAWVRYYACQGVGRIVLAGADARLIERLADPMPHVRIAAIEALAHFATTPAREALVAAARASDDDTKRAALIGLGRLRDGDNLALLVEAARATNVATCIVALSALAKYDEPRALASIAEAVRSSDVSIRDAAVSLLAERDDAAAATALVTAALELATREEPTAHPVLTALSRPGPARVAAISDALARAADAAALLLATSLGRMHDGNATSALFAGMSSKNAAARRACATVLAAIDAPGARPAIAALASSDPDPDVRRACAAAIGT